MTASAADYLACWVGGRHEDLPDTVNGTVRLDIRDDGSTDHWFLTIGDQQVGVSRSAEAADLVVAGDREVFDRLVAEGTHIGAALVRNDVTAQGDLRLLMVLRRLLPGPPDARHPREVAVRAAAARHTSASHGGERP
ncbi:SCP2 sterol-binding domain-containing protein [Micromonospora sp. WMMD712]|uniref:SCP2 sterol-binding domain-containing protein n=1 Tax=Micromonospora sp. WMMD712 TaxID=3016096 RepID=UPI00249A894D|nr:SCP2 sterol-binding domain-containing protein [Micromonospora sp. WMMD712]WFE60950.1 SCP2 sterol-binding domain-containing protein [Micromonospora sp. WMMD712]